MYPNCPTYVILVALFSFGVGYNWLVGKLERRGHDRGYMGFIVAFGCTVTLLGAGDRWLGLGSLDNDVLCGQRHPDDCGQRAAARAGTGESTARDSRDK